MLVCVDAAMMAFSVAFTCSVFVISISLLLFLAGAWDK
jgi:hypothetical protein